MFSFSPAFPFAFISWALAGLASSQDNYFVNPPSAGPNGVMPTNEDLTQCPVYALGDVVTLEWVANFSNTDVGVWYYPGNSQGGWSIGAFNLISNNDTRTLSWTVGPPSLLTEAGGRGNVFWINVYQNSPPYINLNSRAFNVTNTTASSSSSTSVAAAPTSNTAHPSSQGPIATVTISATETVTMSPQPTLPVGNGRNNSVGLGVGLGLGVPFAVLLGIAIYHYYFGNSSHRRGRVVAESGFAPNAASGGDEKEIVAVTEAYREVLPPAPAELVGTVQRHELDGKGMYHVYPGT